MRSEDILKLPLYKWTRDNPNNSLKNGVETCYHGEYHFEIKGHHFYIDLRCNARNVASSVFCRLFTYLSTDELYLDDILRHIPELNDRIVSPQDLRNACELFIEERGSDIYDYIKKLEYGRREINDDEWESFQVSNFHGEEKHVITWKIIDVSGRIYKKDRLLLTAQCCSRCMSPIVKSKFITPQSWYSGIDVREGLLYFCPKCQRQIQACLIDDDFVIPHNRL